MGCDARNPIFGISNHTKSQPAQLQRLARIVTFHLKQALILSINTLRDVCYYTRWFWTTIRYWFMITVFLCWTTSYRLPKYRFPVPIDFKSCREEIAGALQEFCNRWCKREHVESNALNSWKLNIFKIIDGRISFYCNNLDLLPPKPKFTFRHLKKGIQEFHRKFVLAPADKAANNVVVI